MTQFFRRLAMSTLFSLPAFTVLPATVAAEELDAVQADDAARLRVVAEVDARKAGLQELRYGGRMLGDVYTIYPVNRDIVEGFNLVAPIEADGWVWDYFEFRDTDRNSAYLTLTLASVDEHAFEIADVTVEVEDSRLVPKPFLKTEPMLGCIGHRPEFGLANHGWGPVADAVLRYRFVRYGTDDAGETAPGQETATFETTVSGFGDAVVVSVAEALAPLGVDTQTLSSRRLSCDLGDFPEAEDCMAQVLERTDFGALAPLVRLEENLVMVGIEGDLEFSWHGADGALRTATQPLRAEVSLAWVDWPVAMADFYAYEDYADVPDHIRIDLEVGRSGYVLPVDYRGQREGARIDIPVKFNTDAASVHDFRFAVRLADGSVQYGDPMRLIYVQPRAQIDFEPIYSVRPDTCFEFQ